MLIRQYGLPCRAFSHSLIAILLSTALILPQASLAASQQLVDGQRLELSLRDAIEIGIEKNLGVEIERHRPLIAWEEARSAWGAYDPEFFAEYGWSDVEAPTASTLIGPILKEEKWEGKSGIKGLVPWLGASYDLTLTGDQTKTNNPTANLSPAVNSELRAVFNIPLLKGLVWNEAWTGVKVSRIGYEAEQANFKTTLMDTVSQIVSAYWGLTASREQERVAIKSLESTQALLEQTQTQYEVGVVSKVEVVEAEAGVAERDVALIQAENARQAAEDQLVNLVFSTELRAESQLNVVPSDSPEGYIDYAIDSGAVMQKAQEKRPELAAARHNIERNQIQLRFAKNQRLPQLDVRSSYGYQGLGGKRNSKAVSFGPPAPPVSLDSSFDDTFDDFLKEEGKKQWSATGVFSIPLGNVKGRHDVTKAELELRRADRELKRLEQSIVLEVRNATRNLISAQKGIEAAERRRLAAAEQFRAEGIRLEQGESTPFDVLQRERDLVDAESQKINALRVYRDSVTELHRAQGSILEEHNIAVEEAGALR